MRRVLALAALVVAAAACDDGAGPTGSDSLVVMTYNVYLGANVDPIITAPAESVPFRVAEAWAVVQQTNFPARAGRIAALIAKWEPHVVGLQEVAVYRTQTPGDLVLGGTTPATTVAYDFLKLLLDSLAARGATYVVAAADTANDIEAPALTGIDPGTGQPQFTDIRFTDRDVILARAGVTLSEAQGGQFTARIPLSLGGVPIAIVRGWSAVTATIAGRQFRFANTHLDDFVEQVQVAQANELLAQLDDDVPSVLVGDFNSAATGADTPTYGLVTGAGFADAWNELNAADPGYTCCNAPTLDNPTATLDERIDLVLTRNGINALSVSRVGHLAKDQTASGLWPSDHVGVVAVLSVPRP